MRVILTTASAIAISGCVATNREQALQAIGPSPSNFKEIAAGYVKDSFFDPYSLRDTLISTPFFGHLYFQDGWLVCIKMNAKNRMGAYVGLSETALLIKGGKVVNSMLGPNFCSSSSYQFWPEMDSAKRAGFR